jgi:hypothetical protein
MYHVSPFTIIANFHLLMINIHHESGLEEGSSKLDAEL